MNSKTQTAAHSRSPGGIGDDGRLCPIAPRPGGASWGSLKAALAISSG